MMMFCLDYAEENVIGERLGSSNDLHIVDIDADSKDPLECSLYAPDIYSNIQLTEVAIYYRMMLFNCNKILARYNVICIDG